MAEVKWTLPVPSTALLEGPSFEMRLGREAALSYSYEGPDDLRCPEAVVFQGVEAFKCTYYRARDPSMLVAYDRLVDRGTTAWLEEVRANLAKNAGDATGLVHLMINFDDGPAYEFVCRSFRIEKAQGTAT
jgi:hypothetical protein